MTQLRFTNRPAHRPLDNFFSEFFNVPSVWNNPSQVSGLPAANVIENEGGYELELNVPGRNRDDIKINVEKDLLTVSFETKNENTDENVKTVRREFTLGSFKRSFSLDEKIDVSAIQAKYENGLLRISLPKKEAVKEAPKQITIS